jgi:hypothetical protein
VTPQLLPPHSVSNRKFEEKSRKLEIGYQFKFVKSSQVLVRGIFFQKAEVLQNRKDLKLLLVM